MLYHQHLKPWLLIYVLTSVFSFLSFIGILVMIFLNDINGFDFTSTIFSTCPPYTNLKLNMGIKIGLEVCFVMSCLGIVVFLGQSIVSIWQLVIFTKWSKDNNQSQTRPFENLSLKIFILLYVLNALGFLAIVPIVGWFGTFFMEMSQCSGLQNQSDTYTLPAATAGASFIFQFFSFGSLLKLCYNFHQDSDDQSQQNSKHQKGKLTLKQEEFETPESRRIRQKQELEEIKRRILQTKDQQNQFKNQMGNPIYLSNSTNQSPNTMKDNLLNKNSPQNHLFGTDNNFIDQKQFKRKKKKNLLNFSHNNFQTPISSDTSQDPMLNSQNSSYQPNPNYIDTSLSPISVQQRKMMKKLNRNSSTKKRIPINGPNDIIFQNLEEDDMNSLNNQPIKKRIKPLERHLNEEEDEKAMIEIKKLQNMIDTISPKTTKSGQMYIFKTKYNHMIHLFKKQNKIISPAQRRCIKRPLLAINSLIVQFDAKNYEVDEFASKGQNNPNQKYMSNTSQKQVEYGSNKLTEEQKNQPISKQTQPMNQVNLQIIPQPVSRMKPMKTAAQIWQHGFSEGKKAQYYNPINGYVEQGQQYEDRIKKILEFQQIGLKKRTHDDPFAPIPNKQKHQSSKEKLYLHKNKPKIGRTHQPEDMLEEYEDRSDPLKDMAFDDDLQAQRGALLRDDTNNEKQGKSEKKGILEGLLNTAQPARRINRKEGGLIELIRGKQPFSYL